MIALDRRYLTKSNTNNQWIGWAVGFARRSMTTWHRRSGQPLGALASADQDARALSWAAFLDYGTNGGQSDGMLGVITTCHLDSLR